MSKQSLNDVPPCNCYWRHIQYSNSLALRLGLSIVVAMEWGIVSQIQRRRRRMRKRKEGRNLEATTRTSSAESIFDYCIVIVVKRWAHVYRVTTKVITPERVRFCPAAISCILWVTVLVVTHTGRSKWQNMPRKSWIRQFGHLSETSPRTSAIIHD